jgi:hypothetical protein
MSNSPGVLAYSHASAAAWIGYGTRVAKVSMDCPGGRAPACSHPRPVHPVAEGVLASSRRLIGEHEAQLAPLVTMRHNERRWRGRTGEVTIRSAAQCRANHDKGPYGKNDRDLNAVIAAAMARERKCSRKSYMSGAWSAKVK